MSDANSEIELVVKTMLESQGLDATQEQVQKLTGTIAQLNKELEQVKKKPIDVSAPMAKNVASMAAGQRAAAGMGMALNSVGSGAKGSVPNIAGLTSGLTSMFTAIKMGMGPLGWVLLAIQGLQMGISAYNDAGKQATETQKSINEELKAYMDAQVEHLNNLALKHKEALLDGLSTKADEEIARISKGYADLARQRAAADATEDRAAQSQSKLLQEQAQAARSKLSTLEAQGKVDAEAAAARRREIEENLRRELAAIDETSAARKLATVDQARQRIQAEKRATEEALQRHTGKYEKVLKVGLPDEADIAQMNRDLQRLGHPDQAAAFARQMELKELGQSIREKLTEMGDPFEGTDQEVIAYARELQKRNKSLRLNVARLDEEYKVAVDNTRAQVQIRDASKAEAAAKEQTARAQQEQLRATQEQKKLTDQWTELQRSSLAEQEHWLKEQLASLQEGSEAYKTMARNLRGVKDAQVTEQLSKLGDTIKVTTNYVLQENRTQSQIIKADKAALAERERQLQQLALSPGLDHRTQEQINKALKDTRDQQRALAQAVNKSRLAAQRQLDSFKASTPKAKNKGFQGALNRLNKAYEQAAQKAKKAAEKGDDKAMARAEEQLRVIAKQRARLAADSNAVLNEHRGVLDQVRQVRQGTTAENKGLTARQADQKLIKRELESRAEQERRLKREAKQEEQEKKKALAAAKKSGKAAADAAAADSTTAAAAKKAAAASKTSGSNKKAPAQVADLTTQLNAARAELAQMTANTQQLSTAIAALSSSASAGASAAASAASAAASGQAKLSKDIAACQQAIRKLQNA